MAEKFRTLRLPRAEAAAIYARYALMQEGVRGGFGLPQDAATIRSWREATIVETRRRQREIATGSDEMVTVEMLYDYPRDMINFYNRLSGDPEE